MPHQGRSRTRCTRSEQGPTLHVPADRRRRRVAREIAAPDRLERELTGNRAVVQPCPHRKSISQARPGHQGTPGRGPTPPASSHSSTERAPLSKDSRPLFGTARACRGPLTSKQPPPGHLSGRDPSSASQRSTRVAPHWWTLRYQPGPTLSVQGDPLGELERPLRWVKPRCSSVLQRAPASPSAVGSCPPATLQRAPARWVHPIHPVCKQLERCTTLSLV